MERLLGWQALGDDPARLDQGPGDEDGDESNDYDHGEERAVIVFCFRVRHFSESRLVNSGGKKRSNQEIRFEQKMGPS